MKRIIIADDSATARMIIKRCFEIAGCHEANFAEAANGLEVLKLLKETPADLIASDLNMPEMDGMELLQRIKSSPQFRNIPVIIISSSANPKMIGELKSMGVFAILNKPLSPANIRIAIEPLLRDTES
ncbi:MAG: response regulator [Pseudomonadota bacterium]